MLIPLFDDGTARLIFGCRTCGNRWAHSYEAGSAGPVRRVGPWTSTPRQDMLEAVCGHCGGGQVDAQAVYSEGGTAKCGPRCTHARGPRCVCSCGGKAHGAEVA